MTSVKMIKLRNKKLVRLRHDMSANSLLSPAPLKFDQDVLMRIISCPPNNKQNPAHSSKNCEFKTAEFTNEKPPLLTDRVAKNMDSYFSNTYSAAGFNFIKTNPKHIPIYKKLDKDSVSEIYFSGSKTTRNTQTDENSRDNGLSLSTLKLILKTKLRSTKISAKSYSPQKGTPRNYHNRSVSKPIQLKKCLCFSEKKSRKLSFPIDLQTPLTLQKVTFNPPCFTSRKILQSGSLVNLRKPSLKMNLTNQNKKIKIPRKVTEINCDNKNVHKKELNFKAEKAKFAKTLFLYKPTFDKAKNKVNIQIPQITNETFLPDEYNLLY